MCWHVDMTCVVLEQQIGRQLSALELSVQAWWQPAYLVSDSYLFALQFDNDGRQICLEYILKLAIVGESNTHLHLVDELKLTLLGG